MKKHLLLFSLLPVLALTSCGYGLRELYYGSAYNSADFTKNYYSVWNDEITGLTGETTALDYERDSVFTSWNDTHFDVLEPKKASKPYVYAVGKDRGDAEIRDEDGNITGYKYGPSVKLSKTDSSFKDGMISKLFDGQTFCDGYTTKARIQVYPEHVSGNPSIAIDDAYTSGFGFLFEKECTASDYFAINFKSFLEVNDTGSQYMWGVDSSSVGGQDDRYSSLELHISFYTRSSDGLSKHTYTYPVSDVPTNFDDYVFFGFSMKSLGLSRIAGFSLEYRLDSLSYNSYDYDENGSLKENNVIDAVSSCNLHYGLWLYEIFMPNSSWH